jgi:hypothetical protein
MRKRNALGSHSRWLDLIGVPSQMMDPEDSQGIKRALELVNQRVEQLRSQFIDRLDGVRTELTARLDKPVTSWQRGRKPCARSSPPGSNPYATS